MKMYILIILIFCLFSCNDDFKNVEQIDINLQNKSNFKIDSLKLFMADISEYKCDSILVKDILPNIENSVFWKNFNSCKTDGNYIVKAFYNNKIIERKVGYYTNGLILDKKIVINVYNDSIVATTIRK